MHRAPANDVLVTAFNGHVFGIESATGTIRWTHDMEYPDEVEIAIEDGVVIAATAQRIGFFDLATGHVHTIVKIPGEYSGRPTMIVSGGHIYIGRNGTATCMTTRGQPVWTQSFDGKGLGGVSLGFAGNVRQADDPGSK